MEKICGIYKIANTVTGDFYIGSSKNVKKRWADHKCPSRWNDNPNNPMYLDMRKYGTDKFVFEVLEEVEPEELKEVEQKFIEMLKPTYNNINANGLNVERCKETKKECQKKYRQSNKYKEYQKEFYKEYQKTEKYKESHRKASNKYNNQLCCFNGETITLCALSRHFRKAGIPHPTAEAKKYLLKQ